MKLGFARSEPVAPPTEIKPEPVPLPTPLKVPTPEGRPWGSTAGVTVDRKGNIWVAERCGANSCAGSKLAPVLEFDPSGKFLTSFGAEMFVFPHGITADRDGNIWVTDGDGKDGKGHQVFKFSPAGKVLMTLGKAGVAGDGAAACALVARPRAPL